jgi:subtilisin family serine protease
VQRRIKVVNLSLAGPENTALTEMLLAAEAAGVLVVAAVGNAGPVAPPAWPAAHEGALAVTAVDVGGRIYRKAQRGAHVDMAAPGVDVWAAASIKGVKPRTGTSYAAPYATAAAAILASKHPDWSPAELAAALRSMTEDAGSDGADEVFGAGILSLGQLCADTGE